MAVVTWNAPVSAEVKSAIDRILREKLARFGYESATIEPGEDHDGDPVLFIDAQYTLSEEPIDADAAFTAAAELGRKLLSLGEFRFPHLRHHFDERQKVRGFR